MEIKSLTIDSKFWEGFRLQNWNDVCKLTPEEKKILEEMYETTIPAETELEQQ
jgi:hypothetical protein